MSSLNAVQANAVYITPGGGRCAGHPIVRGTDSSGLCKPWSYNHTVLCVWCHRPMVQFDVSGTVTRTVAAVSTSTSGQSYTFQQYGAQHAHAQHPHVQQAGSAAHHTSPQYAYGQTAQAAQHAIPQYDFPNGTRYPVASAGGRIPAAVSAPALPVISAHASPDSPSSSGSELGPYTKKTHHR